MSWKRFLQCAISAIILAVSVSLPATALAQGFVQKIRGGVEQTASPAGLNQTTSLENMIGNTIKVAISFVGVLLLAYVLYAGYIWLTSNGDSKKTEQAIKILRTAIVGMIIILAAYAITDFVLARLSDIAGSGSTVGTPANSEPTQ